MVDTLLFCFCKTNPHRFILHEVGETCLAAAGNQGLDFLRTSTGSYHEGIGHVNNDEIVYAETGDETAGAGDDNATGGLLSDNYGLLV